MMLFSQYLRNIPLPVLVYRRGKGWEKSKLEIFKLFPVLLTIVSMWALCAILTTAALNYPTYKVGNETFRPWSDTWLKNTKTRTDTNLPLLAASNWFRFPYPCKIMICEKFKALILILR